MNDEFLTAFTKHAGDYANVSPGTACQCCETCREDYGTDDNPSTGEPWFSWQTCETCGSIAGDRYAAHAWRKDENPQTDAVTHLAICEDCVMFTANGDIPDNWKPN